MKQLLQRVLDAAEDFAARRRWYAITFHIIHLKDVLGLRIHR